jgi:glycerophosphoryl diester phosphodiesterase
MGPVSGPPQRPARPIGFAHRGGRAERPENTIGAFERALEVGATGLESDVWVTDDGVAVLDHDGVVGPIWRRRAMATTQRSALPPHVPSLGELYDKCGTDFELSLDVKDPAALGPTLELSGRLGATSRLWLCHHDWRQMAGWKRITADAHLVESTRMAWIPEGLATRCAALREAGIDALNLHRVEWDASGVDAVHESGVLAFAWDAQTEQDIRRLVDLGIDGIYSDHVERLMTVINIAER